MTSDETNIPQGGTASGATAWTPSYWLDVAPIEGDSAPPPRSGGILVIGSGLAGVSTAYWLLENGFDDITIVDFELKKSATFRNCGHILYGTVESMKALAALHGRETAREIWGYSIGACHEVRDTVKRLGLEVDYKQDGYLVIAIDETENQEILDSVELLNSMDFQNSYVERSELERKGFRNVYGARFEPGSAQAHPTKFRNGLMRECLKRGVKYHSGVRVTAVEEAGDAVAISTANAGELRYDAAVLAGNAYTPLFSRFFEGRRLVEPFRGQIIASRPLSKPLPVSIPHSFDHGYEYALRSPDNRLIIGGWRNHTPNGEVGTYDIIPNPEVERGLREFVARHYSIDETIEWEYSWAGIMAASKTGFYFIGPTSSPRIFTCAGCTSHGFSWAHGSAKLLADIIAGNPIPPVARFFNPMNA